MTFHQLCQRIYRPSMYPTLNSHQRRVDQRTFCDLENLPSIARSSNSTDALLIKGRKSEEQMRKRNTCLTDYCAEDCINSHRCCSGKRNDSIFCYNDDKAYLGPMPWHSSKTNMHGMKTGSRKGLSSMQQPYYQDSSYPSRYKKNPQLDVNDIKKHLKKCIRNRYMADWSEEDDRVMEEHLLNMIATSIGRNKVMVCLKRVQEKCLNEDKDLLEFVMRLKHCARTKFDPGNIECRKTRPVQQTESYMCLHCNSNPCQCSQAFCTDNDSDLRGGHDRYGEYLPWSVDGKEFDDEQRPNCSDMNRDNNHTNDWDNNFGRDDRNDYRTTHQRDYPEDSYYICPTCHQQRWFGANNGVTITKSNLPDMYFSKIDDGPIDGLLPPKSTNPLINYSHADPKMVL